MYGVQLADLLDAPPAGVTEALDLVTGLDMVFGTGFARLGGDQTAALVDLANGLAGTSLGVPVAEAVEKLTTGSVAPEHVGVLAAGRAALLGAVHDALLAQLDDALGRDRAPAPSPEPGPGVPGVDNLLAGCRSWLHELAITGWRGVDHDMVSAGDPALRGLLAEPRLRRLAVLLDGLAAELRAHSPVGTMSVLPTRRWSDLWSRAALLAHTGDWATETTETVSGRLLVLGVDVHEHATAVQVQVHGVFEPADAGPARLVRSSVAGMKVDTIVGPAVWQMLGDHSVLLAALAGGHALELTDVPLSDSGDLVWHDDRARVGEQVDPFAMARVRLAGALAPTVAPLDRHPVRIAEPVLLEGYQVQSDEHGLVFNLGGHPLCVDTERLPGCGPLTPKAVSSSTACIGLLRWDDNRWTVQPLAVQTTVKKQTVTVGTAEWAKGPTDPRVVKAMAKSGDAVAVLRERAGRLLRR